MVEYMLTTVDNPFNPHTQFSEWNAYDQQLGHHTTAFLARVLHDSDELSDAQRSHAYQLAVDEIARENVSGMHRKVAPPNQNSKQ